MFRQVTMKTGRNGLQSALTLLSKPANISVFGSTGSSSTSVLCRYLSFTRTPPTPEEVTQIWKNAEVVCFDVDCTVCKQDGLDMLAEFLGKGQAVRDLTNLAMNGTLGLEDALQARLDIMSPSIQNLNDWITANPGAGRLVPGITELIDLLRSQNKLVYLISGNFRELILPVSDYLKVPRENLFANRFIYTASEHDTSTFYPQVKVKTFDVNESTCRAYGKAESIRQIRKASGKKLVVMVGDGITDLETIQEEGGADMFVGYGGVVVRDVIKANADWFVTDYEEMAKLIR